MNDILEVIDWVVSGQPQAELEGGWVRVGILSHDVYAEYAYSKVVISTDRSCICGWSDDGAFTAFPLAHVQRITVVNTRGTVAMVPPKQGRV